MEKRGTAVDFLFSLFVSNYYEYWRFLLVVYLVTLLRSRFIKLVNENMTTGHVWTGLTGEMCIV